MRRFVERSFAFRVLLAVCLLLQLPSSSASQELVLVSPDGKPVVHGVSSRFRRTGGLCLDYGKTRLRNGQKYKVVEPSRTITSHEGMDFCKRAGSPVISPVNGRIKYIEQDNAVYGGVVGISMDVSVRPRPGQAKQKMFLEMVHVVPVSGLRRGQRVQAGQVVAYVQKANRPSIGKTPHVHFAVRRCDHWPTCHVDPNLFWRDGPGRLSCYDPAKPLPKGRIVAPVPC